MSDPSGTHLTAADVKAAMEELEAQGPQPYIEIVHPDRYELMRQAAERRALAEEETHE